MYQIFDNKCLFISLFIKIPNALRLIISSMHALYADGNAFNLTNSKNN